jgi:hypothetical protein
MPDLSRPPDRIQFPTLESNPIFAFLLNLYYSIENNNPSKYMTSPEQGFNPEEDEKSHQEDNSKPKKGHPAIVASAVLGAVAAGGLYVNHQIKTAEDEDFARVAQGRGTEELQREQELGNYELRQSLGSRAIVHLRDDLTTASLYEQMQKETIDPERVKIISHGIDPTLAHLSKEEIIKYTEALKDYLHYGNDKDSDTKTFNDDFNNPDNLLVRIINEKKDPEVRKAALNTLIQRQENGSASYIKESIENGKDIIVSIEPPTIVAILREYEHDPELSKIVKRALSENPQWERGEKYTK